MFKYLKDRVFNLAFITTIFFYANELSAAIRKSCYPESYSTKSYRTKSYSKKFIMQDMKNQVRLMICLKMR